MVGKRMLMLDVECKQRSGASALRFGFGCLGVCSRGRRAQRRCSVDITRVIARASHVISSKSGACLCGGERNAC